MYIYIFVLIVFGGIFLIWIILDGVLLNFVYKKRYIIYEVFLF